MSNELLTLKEKTAAIRSELKELGISNKQISVKGKYVTYDESINVTIKDLTVKKSLVEEIAKKYKSVDYDEYNGEILAGGNTYVNIDFDYNVWRAAKDEFLKVAENIIEKYDYLKITGQGETLFSNENMKVIYFPSKEYDARIGLYETKQAKDEFGEYTTLNNIERRAAYNEYAIAEALAIFKYQYDIKIA